MTEITGETRRRIPSAVLALCLLATPVASDPPASHDDVSCGACHLLRASADPWASGSDDTSAACIRCHGRSPSSSPFHASGDDCTRCHSFHEPQSVTAGGTLLALRAADASASVHCALCHDGAASKPALSEGHRTQAARFYHAGADALAEQSVSEPCRACHTTSGSGGMDFDRGDAPRFSQHGNHPVSVPVIGGAGNDRNHIRFSIDPKLVLYDGRLECPTCHDLTSRTPDLLVAYEPAQALCNGCHQHNP